MQRFCRGASSPKWDKGRIHDQEWLRKLPGGHRGVQKSAGGREEKAMRFEGTEGQDGTVVCGGQLSPKCDGENVHRAKGRLGSPKHDRARI